MVAANARYGLTSPPATRLSSRIPLPCPTARNAHVRLSWPQASPVGANEPYAKRLYELTLGAKKNASSAVRSIWPATYAL